MNTYDVEIIYKSDETEYDTLYPKTVDDNVTLSNDVLGEFKGVTVADALIELKQSIPSSLELVEQATPNISVDSTTGLVVATCTQKPGYVKQGVKSSTYLLQSVEQATPTISVDNTGLVTINIRQTQGFVREGTKTASYQVPSIVQATPTISINATGLITASSLQSSAGYVPSGTKTATKQLNTKGATTYTPTTYSQTISSGVYLTGTQTIQGSSNLVASNIKSGVTIFNITGNLSGDSSSSAWRKAKDVKFVNTSQYPFVILVSSQADVDSSGHVTFNSNSVIGADYIELAGYESKTIKMWGGDAIYFYILHSLTRNNKINCTISPASAGIGYLGANGYGQGNVGNSYTAPSYPITVNIEVKDYPYNQGG